MKKTMAILLATLLVSVFVGACADKENMELTVRGTATVTAVPDMAMVTANASVKADTITHTQEKMQSIIANVSKKLMEMGVQEKDIVTENYSFYPTYDYSGDVPRMTGYQGNHILSITCRDVDMLDGVVSVLADNGINELYSVSFDVSNRSALYEQALTLAVRETVGKAEKMAEALDVMAPVCKEIVEDSGCDYGVVVNGKEGLASSARAEYDNTFYASEVGVRASVTAVYEATRK